MRIESLPRCHLYFYNSAIGLLPYSSQVPTTQRSTRVPELLSPVIQGFNMTYYPVLEARASMEQSDQPRAKLQRVVASYSQLVLVRSFRWFRRISRDLVVFYEILVEISSMKMHVILQDVGIVNTGEYPFGSKLLHYCPLITWLWLPPSTSKLIS